MKIGDIVARNTLPPGTIYAYVFGFGMPYSNGPLHPSAPRRISGQTVTPSVRPEVQHLETSVEILWLPPAVRNLRREILDLLSSKSRKPLGVHPPTLIALSDIYLGVAQESRDVDKINSLLFDLEVEQLVQSDTYPAHPPGEHYFGLHPATIFENDEYIRDPDLVCEHCNRIQTTGCIGGGCGKRS